MELRTWFWIIMFLWLIGSLWGEYVAGAPYPFRRAGWNLGIFMLFVILGWRVFGSPVS